MPMLLVGVGNLISRRDSGRATRQDSHRVGRRMHVVRSRHCMASRARGGLATETGRGASRHALLCCVSDIYSVGTGFVFRLERNTKLAIRRRLLVAGEVPGTTALMTLF